MFVRICFVGRQKVGDLSLMQWTTGGNMNQDDEEWRYFLHHEQDVSASTAVVHYRYNLLSPSSLNQKQRGIERWFHCCQLVHIPYFLDIHALASICALRSFVAGVALGSIAFGVLSH